MVCFMHAWTAGCLLTGRSLVGSWLCQSTSRMFWSLAGWNAGCASGIESGQSEARLCFQTSKGSAALLVAARPSPHRFVVIAADGSLQHESGSASERADPERKTLAREGQSKDLKMPQTPRSATLQQLRRTGGSDFRHPGFDVLPCRSS